MKKFNSLLCLLLITTSLDLFAQQVLRGPYLQDPTSESIVVMWRTDVANTGRVYYGNDPSNLTDYVDESGSTTEHSVEISGLSDFTKYFYSIGTTTQTLSGPDSNHHFITSPIPGTVQPIRVWAIGDFGKGNEQQKLVRDAYVDYTKDHHTDVWIWLGDNAYDNGTDQEYQAKVFDSVNAYYNIMQYLPFMPCPGNHDYGSVCAIPCGSDPYTHSGPYYDIVNVPTNGEAGGVASGTEVFYSYDYGNVHFISLNSEVGSPISSSNDWTGVNPLGSFNGSPMTDWLEQDLQANDKPWVIAYWHQVPYSKGSHDSDDLWEIYMKAMRENFNPILEQYGVDLVICGHSHVYERSYLIKGHYGTSDTWDPNTMLVDGSSGNYDMGEPYVKKTYGPKANEGTVYMTVGNSGSNESSPALNHPIMYTGYGGDNLVGSLVLDINGNRLDSKYLASDGTIMDEFTMMKDDSTSTSITPTESTAQELIVSPNPFSNKTTLHYTLDKAQHISVKVFDLTRKEVVELLDADQVAGDHRLDFDGSAIGLAKGVYVIKLYNESGMYSQKVVKFR